MNRPNIVYVHGHDAGRNVQPYGYAVQTPVIQRLAEAGVLFRQAFSAAPTCSPSRAALLTGQSPHEAGMLGLAHRGFGLTHPERHVANVLSDHGYFTILAGMQHVTSGDSSSMGYHLVMGQDDQSVGAAAAPAAQLIEQRLASKSDRPFFLDIGFSEAHRPYADADPREARFVRPPSPIPDTIETRMDTARFHRSLQELDEGFGIVLDAIDTSSLAENTLVICTTDHGPAFPGMKSTVTDHGLGVMLIARGPGFAGGQTYDELVSHLDIYPTLCEVAGIEAPNWLEGKSLCSPVANQSPVRDAAFGEVTFHAAYEPQRTIRTERWRYIRRFGTSASTVMPNIDEGLTRSFLLQAGLRERSLANEYLFDCLFDPGQSDNLAGLDEYSTVRAELAGRLLNWMKDTNDPLLDELTLPPGVMVNDPTALSPEDVLVPFELTRDSNI